MPETIAAHLLPLFKKRFPDFINFQQEDSSFVENEEYKRDILSSWNEANGKDELSKLASNGHGIEALKFLRRAAKFGRKAHPIGRYDIDSNLEKDDAKLARLFVEVAEIAQDSDNTPEECIDKLLTSCEKGEIPINWALFFFLLWLFRPEVFFPVKIKIIRAVAEKCGFEIKAGSFNPEAVKQIYAFVSTVYEELSEYAPRDLLDAQSFIWSCYEEIGNNNEMHKIWAEFLERWPIERLRTMTLEEYTNLKSNTDDYFCHWVERKTHKLGSIQGGTSAKFGIYRTASEKPKLKNGQKFENGYVWWESLGENLEAAFETLRGYIVELVESVERGEFVDIIKPQPGSTVQMKICFLYQQSPYSLLPIYSHNFINYFSEKLLGRSCKRGQEMLQANLDLRKHHFPDGDPFEIAIPLWDEFNRKDRRYWAGGFYGGSEIVNQFISSNEWHSGFNEETAQTTSDGQVFLSSYPEVEVGDWLAMKGSGKANHFKIYYVGEVVDKDAERFAIKLKPIKSPNPLPFSCNNAPRKGGQRGWKGTTLAEVTNPEAIEIIFGVKSQFTTNSAETMTTPKELNQILYGPPGTGKTYKTVRSAVELIDGDYEQKSANGRFQELKREGRIEFLTFHQSYSYEDFVEGIRPAIDDDGEARFTCQNGIFKEMAIKATFACLEETAGKEGPSFSQLWEKLIEVIDEDDTFRLKLKTQSYIPRMTARGNIEATKEGEPDRVFGNCGRKPAQEVFTKLKTLEEVNSGDVRRAMDRGANWHLIAAVVNELKKLEIDWNDNPDTTTAATPDDVAEDEMENIVSSFLRKGEESGYKLMPHTEWPPFVLIIDEINRGNISKILGELITLLEPDKRLGAENQLSVQLPYSKEMFVVPGNLHLIGTMNTADKSIALVDVALRRRFQFEELNPNFLICPDLPEDLRKVMETINQRIMLRKDRDHRIGHAYFMDVDSEESFDAVMKRKMIPLLSEYFYNDWDGLRFVLGENEKDTGLIRPLNGESGIGRTRWQWYYDLSSENDLSPAQVLLNNFKPKTEAESAE